MRCKTECSVVLLLYVFFDSSKADDAIPTCKELVLNLYNDNNNEHSFFYIVFDFYDLYCITYHCYYRLIIFIIIIYRSYKNCCFGYFWNSSSNACERKLYIMINCHYRH